MPRGSSFDGRVRAVIDAVRPCVDGGRFAAKRVVGDDMMVEADCFTDGHDTVRAMLLWRAAGETLFHEVEMEPLPNDVFRGSFPLRSLGRRWRGLFAGLEEDESPDDLAHRPGKDGLSALDHALHATRTLSLLARAVEQALLDEDPVVHPAVTDPTQRTWAGQSSATVEDAMAELAHVRTSSRSAWTG